MFVRSLCRSFAVRATLALLGLAAMAGCSKVTPPFLFNPDISVNIAPINPKWPRLYESLTPAQRVVYNERGRPDLAHIRWSLTRDVSDKELVMRNLQNTGMRIDQTPFSWIYLKDKTEVVFSDAGGYETRPLSDAVQAIMDYGTDPQQVKVLSSRNGKRTEEWFYLSQGVKLRFEDGQLVKADRGVRAVPNYMGQ